MYKRKWLIPAIILIILLGAWVFRWDIEATKALDEGSIKVIKWKQDRWTNTHYIELYAIPTAVQGNIYAIYPATPYNLTEYATNSWLCALLADGLWLIWAIRKELKKRNERQIAAYNMDSESNRLFDTEQLKQEAERLNDQRMLEFFLGMIEKYDIDSTPEETYKQIFNENREEGEKQRIIKNTLQDRYVNWQDLGSVSNVSGTQETFNNKQVPHA